MMSNFRREYFVKKVKGDSALIEAFKATATAVKIAIDTNIVITDDLAPMFSYVFTKKQHNLIKGICNNNGWALPSSNGVLITPIGVAHTFKSRHFKDNCSAEEVGMILGKAYHSKCNITVSIKADRRFIIFSGAKNISVGGKKYHSTAVVEVTNKDDEYAHITAIHKDRV